ncbi:mannose-1-phosphate guanylyltransferase/mannose-6-phosphate isomerase [Rhizobium helianthi]|uniref:mannose-1-phosphate guanylyltransferase n=1 Tax=Rhizobium helianthi TaxID=1132695 RepID=A0ABW4M1N0_9HYPH
MTQKIIPVIMAGGKGTRLWPLSRAAAPKQFIQVVNEKTLFQETLERVADPAIYEAPVVITNQDFRFLVAEQSRAVAATLSGILLEPVARNTAAAIAAAAVFLGKSFGENAILQLLAADHDIDAGEHYRQAITTAREMAGLGKIVAFGITPTEPATGYGYIEQGSQLIPGVYEIKRFIEKPQIERAQEMMDAGGFLWNSGIFMSRVDLLISELQTHSPDVLGAAREAVEKASVDLDFVRLDQASFSSSPDISIDYAVMEKTQNAAVVPSSFEWSDLGSWDAVWKLCQKDDKGNLVVGNASVLDTEGSLILSRHSHLAVQGLKDVAVIAAEDAVYVGRLEDAQKVGRLVKDLASRQATAKLTQTHPTSYRPWGGYTSLMNDQRFQVKRLFVLPGKKLSLQKHFHRSEHWVCVRGTAEVTIGDQVMCLRENESVYVPQGELHRLYNPGKIVLEIIEVQTGSYLGEDDIVRVSDDFGRDTA